MKYGARTLHWDSPMPTTPMGQRHETPRAGDNIAAIRRASGHALDLNITRLAGRNWALHYVTPGLNGYTRVVDARTHRTRRMTPAELVRHGDRWGVDGILRWRRPNGEHPLTEALAIQACVAHHTLAIRELKSPALGTDPAGAKESLRASQLHDHPAWFKTLFNMKHSRGKVDLYGRLGMPVVLIFGRFVRSRRARLAASRRIQAGWGTVQAHATW